MSIVTRNQVKSSLNGSVRQLKQSDSQFVRVARHGEKSKNYLIVTRMGNTEALPISIRVAEELIALGVDYGD